MDKRKLVVTVTFVFLLMLSGCVTIGQTTYESNTSTMEERSRCINNCIAMVCGEAEYSRKPEFSPCEMVFNQTNNETITPDDFSMERTAINLYNAKCSFERMDEKLARKMKMSQGNLWINTFRFGIGESFSDYEESRLYFPITDKFCMLNPKGTKDRYMNYLNTSGIGGHCVYNDTAEGWVCIDPLGETVGDVYTVPRGRVDAPVINLSAKLNCEHACDVVWASELGICTTPEHHPAFLDENASYKMSNVTFYGYTHCKNPEEGAGGYGDKCVNCVDAGISGLPTCTAPSVGCGCMTPFKDAGCYNETNYSQMVETAQLKTVDWRWYAEQLYNQYKHEIATGYGGVTTPEPSTSESYSLSGFIVDPDDINIDDFDSSCLRNEFYNRCEIYAIENELAGSTDEARHWCEGFADEHWDNYTDCLKYTYLTYLNNTIPYWEDVILHNFCDLPDSCTDAGLDLNDVSEYIYRGSFDDWVDENGVHLEHDPDGYHHYSDEELYCIYEVCSTYFGGTNDVCNGLIPEMSDFPGESVECRRCYEECVNNIDDCRGWARENVMCVDERVLLENALGYAIDDFDSHRCDYNDTFYRCMKHVMDAVVHGEETVTLHNPYTGMEFECQSSAECMSGLCSKDKYHAVRCVNMTSPGHVGEIECGLTGSYRFRPGYRDHQNISTEVIWNVGWYVGKWVVDTDCDSRWKKETKEVPVFGEVADDGSLVVFASPEVFDELTFVKECNVPAGSYEVLENLTISDLTEILESNGYEVGGSDDFPLIIYRGLGGQDDRYSDVLPTVADITKDGINFCIGALETAYATHKWTWDDIIWRDDPRWNPGLKCVVIATHALKLTDTGICGNASRVEYRDYGWCEPCTYETMAVQKVSTIEPYCPAGSIDEYGNKKTFCVFKQGDRCDEDVLGSSVEGCGDNDGSDAMCTDCRYAPKEDYGCWRHRDEKWPNIYPGVTYLYNQIQYYQKNNIIPVLDLRYLPDSALTRNVPCARRPRRRISDWEYYDGYDESNCNEDIPGAYIDGNKLYVPSFKGSDLYEPLTTGVTIDIVDSLGKARVLKEGCDSCLVALYVPSTNDSTYEDELEWLEDQFSMYPGAPYYMVNETELGWVDLFAYSFTPNYLPPACKSDGSQYWDCTNTESIDSPIEFSRELLRRYHKPSLIYGLNVRGNVESDLIATVTFEMGHDAVADEDLDHDRWDEYGYHRFRDEVWLRNSSTAPYHIIPSIRKGHQYHGKSEGCSSGLDTESITWVDLFATINFTPVIEEGGRINSIKLKKVRGEDIIGSQENDDGNKFGKFWHVVSESGADTGIPPVGEVGGSCGGSHIGKICEGSGHTTCWCSTGDVENRSIHFNEGDRWVTLKFVLGAGEGWDDENSVNTCDEWTATEEANNAHGLIVVEINYTLGSGEGDNCSAIYRYLFTHQRKFTDVGIIGVIYLDWHSSEPTALTIDTDRGVVRNNNFCALQKWSRKLLGFEKVNTYIKVYADEREDACRCQPCTNEMKRLGLCNPICADGQPCTGYDESEGEDVACPMMCARADKCRLCNDSSSLGGTMFNCTKYYSDGSTEPGPVGTVEDLMTGMYPDVVSELGCCILEKVGSNPFHGPVSVRENDTVKITYVKVSGLKSRNEQIIYPYDGSPYVDCKNRPEDVDICPGIGIPIHVEEGDLVCTIESS